MEMRMNNESAPGNDILHYFIFFILTIFLTIPVISIAADNLAHTSDPATQGAAEQTRPDDEMDLKKYDYPQLPKNEQKQVEKQVEQRERQSENHNMRNQGTIADELTLRFREHQEMIRLFEVLILAVMSILSLAVVLWYIKRSNSCNPRDMLNGAGLVLVIFSTVLVIIIADVEVQLTAAMGVLGGIGGYLFGTMRSSRSTGQEPPKTAPDEKNPVDS
jgi:hypothetical protein